MCKKTKTSEVNKNFPPVFFKTILFEDVKSTQLYCIDNHKKLLENCNFIAIRSKKQSSGIGRNNHKWESPIGNIYTTFLLKLNKNQSIFIFKDRKLSLFISNSVIKTLNFFNIHPTIRWTNDIIVNGKKISGSMCDIVKEKDHNVLVIGIGINVNNLKFSPNVNQPVTSMSDEMKRKFKVVEVYDKLKENLEKDIEKLFNNGFSGLYTELNKILEFKDKKINVFEYSGKTPIFKGILVCINENCSLIVKNEKETKIFPVGPFSGINGLYRIRSYLQIKIKD